MQYNRLGGEGTGTLKSADLTYEMWAIGMRVIRPYFFGESLEHFLIRVKSHSMRYSCLDG